MFRSMTKSFWTTALFSSAYLLLSVACLVQPGSAHPWARVDVFAGSYLLLRALGSAHSIYVSRLVFRSKQLRREWWGINSDPGGIGQVVLLMLADLLIFLDYGHWHLAPGLQRWLLQGLGLGLYALKIAWQMWTDTCLAKVFAHGEAPRTPTKSGPFRYIRHPRYAGMIAGKVSFALIFASPLAWMLAVAWLLMFLRKIQLEEAHMRQLLGPEYEISVRNTPRLIPGIY
jgi:protein-S-isoprenylcysteine O-methyltransferase Ste14